MISRRARLCAGIRPGRLLPLALVALPLLVLFADFFTVLAGYLVAVHQLGVNGGAFMENVRAHAGTTDVLYGMAKGAVFAVMISTLCCFHGFFSEPGPEGVGKATNRAVVSVCVACIILNYLLSEMMYG